MKIYSVVTFNKEEIGKISTTASVLQELEHLYDGHDKEKMAILGAAYDIVVAIINNEQFEEFKK